MFLIAYAFKGQVHVFAGRVKIVSHSSCRTSAILKYICPGNVASFFVVCRFLINFYKSQDYQTVWIHHYVGPNLAPNCL